MTAARGYNTVCVESLVCVCDYGVTLLLLAVDKKGPKETKRKGCVQRQQCLGRMYQFRK